MVVFLWVALLLALGVNVVCVAISIRIRRQMSSFQNSATRDIDEIRTILQDGAKKVEAELRDLKEGVTPDYEKAVQAAKAVNDFNSGIAAILNFDPFETLKTKREDRSGGEQQ